jgi:hypothetical protein
MQGVEGSSYRAFPRAEELVELGGMEDGFGCPGEVFPPDLYRTCQGLLSPSGKLRENFQGIDLNSAMCKLMWVLRRQV